jgi:hypothetical protein
MSTLTGELGPISDLSEWVETENGLAVPDIYRSGVDNSRFAVATVGRAPHLRDVPGVYESDVTLFVDAFDDKDPYIIPDEVRLYGVEGEANVVNRFGRPASAYNGNTPILTDMPAELYKGMIETDVGPHRNLEELYLTALRRKMAEIVLTFLEEGLRVDPASARMQDNPTERDLAPSDYILSNFDVFGKKLLKFIGAGVHQHNDVHAQYLPMVSRYLRLLIPTIGAGLQAAPHAFGELSPDLHEHLSEYAPDNGKDLKKYANMQPHSVRYPSRWATSTDGGVGRRVAYDSVEEYLDDIVKQLKAGIINHPARVLGSHADMRLRPDRPTKKSKNAGRLEICAFDTAAYRDKTLGAHGVFAAVTIRALEKFADDEAHGRDTVENLHNEFPKLFGGTYNKAQFEDEQLERAHQNSLAVAYLGNDAKIVNGMGEMVTLGEHTKEIQRFIGAKGIELSGSVRKEIKKNLMREDKVRKTMKKYSVEGVPSMKGFYKTGKGTASMWANARAEANQAIHHMNQREAMEDGTKDRADALCWHLGLNARRLESATN